jgi:hypothetical protein
MKNILKDIWNDLGSKQDEYVMNSEHAFQSIIYHLLYDKLASRNHKIFIEPCLDNYRPDLMVVEANVVKCLIEIKFSPHNKFNKNLTRKDIRKLSSYLNKSEYSMWYFNKNNAFDIDKQKWGMLQPKFSICDETLLCFMVVGHEKDDTVNADYLNNELAKGRNANRYLILTGTAKHNVSLHASEIYFSCV